MRKTKISRNCAILLMMITKIEPLKSSIKPWLKRNHFLFSLFAFFLIGVIFQLNGSSMGILDPTNNHKIIGVDRPIRSDEFLRTSPFLLSTLKESDGNFSYLSLPTIGPNKTIAYLALHPEEFVFRIFLKGSFFFSAYWWLGFLLLGIGIFINPLTRSRRAFHNYIIFWILIFSPAVPWWSNQIPLILGRILIGLGLIIRSIKISRISNIATMALGVWLLSGAITYYQPWVIVAFLCLSPRTFYEYYKKSKKIKKWQFNFLVGSGIGILPLLFYLIQNSALIISGRETLYPGQRRVISGLDYFWNWAFSAPHQWILLKPETILKSNQSELSLGFLFYIIPVLYFFISGLSKNIKNSESNWTIVGFLIVVLWSIFRMPKISFNPLSYVPAERALTITTVMAPLIFLIYINDLESKKILIKASQFNKSTIAIVTFLLTYLSANSILDSVSNYNNFYAAISAAISSYIVAQLIDIKKMEKGLFLSGLLAFFISGAVNPINQGIDSYKNNTLIKSIMSVESGGKWASDDLYVDAILAANNVESISGQQSTAPDKLKWRILDPTESQIKKWNNGASYIRLAWDNDATNLKISNPGPDQIEIRLNPCDQSLERLGLKYIISRVELNSNCLVQLKNFPNSYLNLPIFAYETLHH